MGLHTGDEIVLRVSREDSRFFQELVSSRPDICEGNVEIIERDGLTGEEVVVDVLIVVVPFLLDLAKDVVFRILDERKRQRESASAVDSMQRGAVILLVLPGEDPQELTEDNVNDKLAENEN